MPKIKIFRNKDWLIRYRVFEVYLDGQRMGYISNGENIEIEAPPGEHRLKIKMGRLNSKSYNFNLYNKDSCSFTVSRNKLAGVVIIILVLFVTFMEIFVRRTFKIERRLLFFVPVGVVLLHTLGFRVHFLNIKDKI